MSREDSYRAIKDRSLHLSDMRAVVRAMEAVVALPEVFTNASLDVMRADGETLATIWWDGESEKWLCDWKKPQAG